MKFPTQTDGARLEALIEELEHEVIVIRQLLDDKAKLKAALLEVTHTFRPLDKTPQFCAHHRCTEPFNHPVHLTPAAVLGPKR